MRHSVLTIPIVLIVILLVTQPAASEEAQAKNLNPKFPDENAVTITPTESPAPSPSPSRSPTVSPTTSFRPSFRPSATKFPTKYPTLSPTNMESDAPTESPKPSPSPSVTPSSEPTSLPTAPTSSPSLSPSYSHKPSPSPSSMPTNDSFELSVTIGAAVDRNEYLDIIEAHVFEIAVKQFIQENLPPANDTHIDSDKYVIPTFVIVRKQDFILMPSSTSKDTALFVEFEVAGKIGPRPFPEEFDYEKYLGYNLNYGFENNSIAFKETVMKAIDNSKTYVSKGEPCDHENCEETKPCARDILPWVFFGVMCIILICTIIWVYRRHCWNKKDENIVQPAITEESFQICTSNSTSNSGIVVNSKPCAKGIDVRKCTSQTCLICADKEKGPDIVAVTPGNGFLARLNMFLTTPRNKMQQIYPECASAGSISDDN